MSHSLSIKEIRNMQLEDLQRELKSLQLSVHKMRLQIRLKKEKDSAHYRREKKTLARMHYVLGEKSKDTLQKPVVSPTVPARPSASKTTKKKGGSKAKAS
jgi:ribosomal protein L29